jgi:hypothetical protein
MTIFAATGQSWRIPQSSQIGLFLPDRSKQNFTSISQSRASPAFANGSHLSRIKA